MTKIKKLISFIIIVLIIYLFASNYQSIDTIITEKLNDIINPKEEIIIKEPNEYYNSYEYKYIDKVNYEPSNDAELETIFYTIINNGWDTFTFYCNESYTSCTEDLVNISSSDKLNYINDFVHPFNSFKEIHVSYDTNKKITIDITYQYTKEEIEYINNELDNIIANNITSNMTDREKIKVLHDYIINNTRFDTDMESNGTSIYDSKRITGLLKDHYAVCSAYTDTMSVLLYKLNILNFKVATKLHVWNAVYLNNTWYHLDLTWDDPVVSDGSDALKYDYFLITDNELTNIINKEIDANKRQQHEYDKSIYIEIAYY